MTIADIENIQPGATVTVTRNEREPLLSDHPLIVRKEAKENPASYIGGVFNLSCTIVGAGIMSLPAAVKEVGIIPGVLLILISGFLTKYSIDVLLRFSDNGRAYSYSQLMEDAFGKIGEISYQICVVINTTGAIVVYLIIIADVISGSTSSGVHHSGLLEEWFGEHWWTGRIFVLMLLTAFVLVPTAWIKRMDSLKYTSAVAVGLAVFFILIVIGIASYKLAMGTIEEPTLFPSIEDLPSFVNLFTAVPVVVIAYQCHFNVHTIQNELEDPTQMQGVVTSTLSVCGTVYIMTGLFGLLLFGDSTASDVLSNFDSDLGVPYSLLINAVVRLSYAAHVILVFPVVFYALRLNFDGLVFKSAVPLASDNMRFASTTLGLLLVILLGAICVPSIWVAFQFTGATSGALICFIFPASIALRDRPKIATKRDKFLSWGLITLAVLADLVAIYSNVVSLL